MSTTLILGDCLSVLNTGELDVLGTVAIITDPPYGAKERTDRKSKGRSHECDSYDFPPIHGDDRPFDPAPWLAFPHVAMCGGNWFASRLPDSSRWLVWDKREGGTPDDNADCELIWTNAKGPARLFHHLWRGMIKASERNIVREHPTQKPVELMRWVIQQMRLPEGTVICDPYMGSGTTGVAAVLEGFDFIGIEREAAYFDVAARRIAQAEAQGDLFREVA